MKIEQKKLSPTETMLYFSNALPIKGSFYCDSNILPQHSLLTSIFQSSLAKTLMLTADFIYLESCDSKSMEDLELFSLSELDDYFSQPLIQQTADEDQPELKIKLLIKTIIAPYLQRDGGNLELISYDAEIVKIHFLGKCQGCPYAAQTLKNHVEKNLIHYLPQIKEVLLA